VRNFAPRCVRGLDAVIFPDNFPDVSGSAPARCSDSCPSELRIFCNRVCCCIAIGSVALFADSIDFLEDTFLNVLIVVGLGWTAQNRARPAMLLACVLLVPGLAMIWTAWDKFNTLFVPAPGLLSLAGFGALTVNMSCAFMLASYRRRSGSLTRAAFLSVRNDALANIAIIATGLVTAFAWRSAWPDLIVGLGIAALNTDAAAEVWRAAREELSTVA